MEIPLMVIFLYASANYPNVRFVHRRMWVVTMLVKCCDTEHSELLSKKLLTKWPESFCTKRINQRNEQLPTK